MATLVPKLTSTPGNPPTYNVGMAETFSWIPVEGADRPLFARAGYITNLSDLSINLSAAELNISSIMLQDGNSTRVADVEDVGGVNALRVATQNSSSTTDTVSLGDKLGSNVTVTEATSSLNVNVTNFAPISFPVTNIDAFGRLRVSNPLTLFDSSHRYQDNNLWTSLTAVGGSATFNSNQGLMDLTVNSLSGSFVARETTKVFSYQSGKSLLTMNTFVMAPSATNVRQRVGYFGKDNGIYFQLDDSNISFVKRTLVNGSPATETVVPLSAWNGDKLDGTGPSGFTLDITKAQIFWMDFEWLGVGTVRCGFIIKGQFIICHSFHHANEISSTYITTASLPLRYEITNKAATSGSRTLKQICSTVISEGGYEMRGAQQAIGTPVTAPRDLTDAGTFYPIITTRLKPTRPDAIVILSALSILGITNNVNYNWKLLGGPTTSGGTGWVSAGDNSSVEYKLDATAVTGGRVLASGFMQGSNQGSTSIDLPKEALFRFQLERDGLTNTPYEITLVATAGTAGGDILASMDWEEVSR